ncbi:XisI protein [Pseudanabaenaceae cyanobacterium LEGE 13415]|nr:XisI protein [Pseudanabaenaceae cyanobacterium LEGE 13415]
MATRDRYTDLLTQVLRQTAATQPRLQSLQIRAVCDQESEQFLIIATGWEKTSWINTILFHARLQDEKVIIEEDNFETGLSSALISAGISPEDILSSDEVSYIDRAVA